MQVVGFQVVRTNLQPPPPSLSALSKAYGCTAEALRLWRDRGADLSDPGQLLAFLEVHGTVRGNLWRILIHDQERARIADEIASL